MKLVSMMKMPINWKVCAFFLSQNNFLSKNTFYPIPWGGKVGFQFSVNCVSAEIQSTKMYDQYDICKISVFLNFLKKLFILYYCVYILYIVLQMPFISCVLQNSLV